MKIKIEKVLEEIRTVSDYKELLNSLTESNKFSKEVLSDVESIALMDYGLGDSGELDPDGVADFVWVFLYKLWECAPHGFNSFMFDRFKLREKAIRKLKIDWEV